MSSTDKQIPAYVRFAIAGAAGVGAVMVSHPFDLIKFRMQMSGKGKRKVKESSLQTTLKVLQNEGVLGLYDGISASILRQLTITMVRLGMYNAIVDQMTADDGTPPPVFYQILAAAFSGGAGAIVGNPSDIVLTRMATHGGLYENEKKKKNLSAVLTTKQMIKEEGLGSLWIGWRPHVFRCIVLNLTQVVLYKNTKVYLLHTGRFQDGNMLQLICILWSSFVSSIATAPLDITKTRLQTSRQEGEYAGMKDAAMKIIKQEGTHSLWRGFTPTLLRIFPHNFVVFILLENLTKLYKSVVLGDTSGTGY